MRSRDLVPDYVTHKAPVCLEMLAVPSKKLLSISRHKDEVCSSCPKDRTVLTFHLPLFQRNVTCLCGGCYTLSMPLRQLVNTAVADKGPSCGSRPRRGLVRKTLGPEM